MQEHTTSRYSAPKLTRHGSFAALTLGSSTGDALDEAFPAGTPKSELTFSGEGGCFCDDAS